MKLEDLEKNENKENFKNFILKDYEGENNGQNCGLAEMIVDNFLDALNDYENDTQIIDIINETTGNNDGSYTYSTYESAKIIAENIFEFNAICDDMQQEFDTQFDITETDKNLVKVLWYILDNLVGKYETVKDLINDFVIYYL